MKPLKDRIDEALRNRAAEGNILQDLYHENEDLKKQLQQAQSTSRKYHDQMTKAQTDARKSNDDMARSQEAMRTLETSLDCDKFVLVLLDGDSMPFLDDMVLHRVEGGLDAGRRLRNEVHDYIRTLPNYHADDRVLIHIHANVRGLARAYRQANIVRDEETVLEFVSGLSSSHPLTSFVDAGGAKEAADSKMRAELELFYRNYHCKHIVFGGSDNGYAGFLNTFVNVSGTNDRITFLDSPNTPTHLQRIIRAFKVVQFRDLFRPAKIVTNSTNGTPMNGNKRQALEPLEQSYRRPRSPRPSDEYDPTSPAMVPPWQGPANHPAPFPPPVPSAAMYPPLVQPPFPEAPRYSVPQEPPVSSATQYPAPQVIYQNTYGQRVDPPLKWDKDFLNVLFTARTKLCNNFYLKGHCGYGENCSWDHSAHLTSEQLDTLRHKARTSACRDPFCQDPDCALGHSCPRGDRCNISMCKFLPEMHSIETSQVFEYNPVTQAKVLVHRDA